MSSDDVVDDNDLNDDDASLESMVDSITSEIFIPNLSIPSESIVADSSSVKIQSFFRGFQGRKTFTQLRQKAEITRVLGRIDEVKKELRRSKIMIVGEGCAGKTAFANSIIGKEYEETESTVGINTFMCSVTHAALNESKCQIVGEDRNGLDTRIANNLASKDGTAKTKVDEDMIVKYLANHVDIGANILVSIFDYGGQTVFNIIHQFFLTRYGVYALVFNMEWLASDDMDIRKRCLEFIRFWLDSITVYTYDASKEVPASIIIIGTRKDKVSSPAMHKQISTILCKTFEMKVAWRSIIENTEGTLCFFPIDNTRSRKDPVMKSVMSAIGTSMNGTDYVHQLVPLSWMKTLDEVTNLQRSSITIEEYSSIASFCKVSSSDELDLLRYFHEMGYLMWHDQSALRDIIILDPIDFFVKPVALIICKHIQDGNDPTMHFLPVHSRCKKMQYNRFSALTTNGILYSSLLSILWEDFGDRSAILLNLMCRYGLLVPLLYVNADESSDVVTAPASEKYLVPSLLSSSNQYKEQWLDDGASYQTCFFIFTSSEDMKKKRIIQSTDLKSDGFLPNGLFERLVGKVVGWCQLTSKEVQIDTDLLFKDLVILRYGRQCFRLSLLHNLSSIRLDVEGMNPLEVHDRIFEQIKNCILESMKSLTVFTALRLITDELNHLALVPIDVVRSTVEKSLPLTGASNRTLLTPQLTKERFGPWLKIYNFLDRYDIFVSYQKGPQDKELALAMFTMISNFSCGCKLRAVDVFFDERRLQPGRKTLDSFVQSIVNSTIVVPIFSVDALAKIVKHNPTVVDGVLLEWICALEGFKSDYSRIKYIYPLFYGRRDPVSGEVESVFDCEEFKKISDVIPQATLSKAELLLIENKVFSRAPAGFATKTLRSIVTDIRELSGLSVDDDMQKNFLRSCAENLIKMLDEIDGDTIVPADFSPQTKPLSEFSVDDVIRLLESLNLSYFCTTFQEFEVDGPTLMNCKTVDDVKELGINIAAKAKRLLDEIIMLKKIEIVDVPARSQTKPLSEFSVEDVIHLLESLNLSYFSSTFQQIDVDGPTLMNCKTVDDVKELGINIAAKAKRLLDEIIKLTEKPLEVPGIICFDDIDYMSTLTGNN